MDIRYAVKFVIVFAAVLIELLAHNYWLDLAWNWRILLYYSGGLVLVIVPMLRIYPLNAPSWRGVPILRFLALALLVWYAFSNFSILFKSHPISVSQADMLPVIQIMVERFIQQQPVYDAIPEIWNGVKPIYLPAMWLPYTIPYLIELDIRYLNVGFLMIGFIMVGWLIPSRKQQSWWTLGPILASYLLIYSLIAKDGNYMIQSEEPVVAAYYLFLCYAIYKNEPFSIGMALAFCLLSRYALVAWSILFGVWMFLTISRNKSKIVFGTALIISVILMWITGAVGHLHDFANLPQHYEQAVLDPNLQWKYKPLINHSLGWARYFGYASMETVSLLFKLFVVLIPALCGLLYYKFQSILNKPMFAICSLKICLIFFYGLLIIPYKYLFFTNTIVSLAIFSILLQTDFRQTRSYIQKKQSNYAGK